MSASCAFTYVVFIVALLLLLTTASPILKEDDGLVEREYVTVVETVTVYATPTPKSNALRSNSDVGENHGRNPQHDRKPHHNKNPHNRRKHHRGHKPENRLAGDTGSSTSFTHIIAFGDNLSDNGNGSYAHGRVCGYDPKNPDVITDVPGCHKTIYGHRTWTNGPVAVSYLADMLQVPLLVDYAYGHANGGSKFGATLNNSYTNSLAGAPDGFDQVANYTSSEYASDIASALHFLWIGANDISFWHFNTAKSMEAEKNTNFVYAMSTQMARLVERLVDSGAKKIFVPNLYPKHISPSIKWYGDTPEKQANLGTIIAAANDGIEKKLEELQAKVGKDGVKIVYYNVFDFMMHVWDNHDDYGITHVGGEFCDGYSQLDWNLCVMQRKGREFYWMQYFDMTTRVHQLIAQDMSRAIRQGFK